MMSTTKRSRQQPAETHAASALPASKRLKSSHVPALSPSQAAGSGLGFLVDEDARAGRKLNARLTNGVAPSKATRVDESHAAVMPANAYHTSEEEDTDSEDEAAPATADPEIISLSSNSESSDEETDEEANAAPPRPLTNGHSAASRSQQALVRTEDIEMADAADVTFGDLLQARHPDPIDVQKALQTTDPNGRSLATTGAQNRTTVTPASLGVVLAQALKTKDKDLLEDCFRLNDHSSIRATIQRQQSHQVATLLECIAERIHKRPGRTGMLMTWVQWSLVSHGGYLANQPELMKKLKSLGAVVRERANGLQPLLHLKGKLDLLSAQLELRKSMQAASQAANSDDLDDDENVLYIEGQGQDWSDSDEEDEEAGHTAKRRTGKSLQLKEGDDESSANDDEVALGQMANGAVNGVDDGSSEDETSDEEEGAGVLDIEAEERSSDDEDESTNDEADTDVPSDDDDDDSEGDESDEVAVRQPKHSTLNRKR